MLNDKQVFSGAIKGIGCEGFDLEGGVFLLELLCAELEFELVPA